VEHREPVNSVTAPRHARRPARLAGLLVGAGLLLVAPAMPATAAPVAPTSAEPAAADATGRWLEGIDVSHWQGTIDWAKVASAGKKFAILKATESTNFIDDHYASFHAAAKANGIWTGAYHFARPDATAGDAAKEAAWFASHIGLGAGDLIPALDLEVTGGLSVTALQSWVRSFLDTVTAKTGVRPMIYTSPAFWKKYMGDSQALADAGYRILWVAHWGVTAPTVPANNWGGRGWTFWQYSNCGSVSGISGCVDLDRFNGLDLAPVAFSTFKLTATAPSSVKQGSSGSASVGIVRTNFDAGVELQVAGLPAGASASFDANPVADSSASMTVSMHPDPAATPVGTYPLTITGVANGLTRTTTMNLVVGDGIAPIVSTPGTGLFAGRTLTTAVPIRVLWTAKDPSGISRNWLQRRTNAGSWVGGTLVSPTAAYWDATIASGSSMQPRVRSTDRKSNTSDWVSGKTSRAAIFQQTSPSVTWRGTWRTTTTTAASGGSLKYSTARGAVATFSFTGSSMAWVAAKGPTRGSATVYVDGVYIRTVSLYAKSGQSRAVVFAINWGTNAAHKVEIVNAGTTGHSRVDVDAFLRLNVY
jgi:GH25 family lysozyme M1 (1,4-beta-N-acetylmuramidase)